VAKKTTSLAGLSGLVYSTDAGRHCPECSQPLGSCICKQSVLPEGDGIARVRRESKGRGGKTVTTISGVPLAETALKELASALKRRCGTGGALKDGVIESWSHRDSGRSRSAADRRAEQTWLQGQEVRWLSADVTPPPIFTIFRISAVEAA